MASPRMAQLAQRMCSGGVKQAVTEATNARAREFFSPAFQVGAAGYGNAPPQKEQSYVLGTNTGLGGFGAWWNPLTWGDASHEAARHENAATEHYSGGDKGAQGEGSQSRPWALDSFLTRSQPMNREEGDYMYQLSDVGVAAVVAGGLLTVAFATGFIGLATSKRKR